MNVVRDEETVVRTGRPRGAKAEETAAALLAAARTRFARDGFDATGMRDIAGDVGVNPALLYRYFGSKEDLFMKAVSTGRDARFLAADVPLEEFADRLVDWLREPATSPMGGHPLVWMLRSCGHRAIAEMLERKIREGFTDALAERLDGPDAELRAILVAAWMFGLGVLESVVGVHEIADADRDSLAEWMGAALGPLLRGER
jgi:AcrR family transcriptional regulator